MLGFLLFLVRTPSLSTSVCKSQSVWKVLGCSPSDTSWNHHSTPAKCKPLTPMRWKSSLDECSLEMTHSIAQRGSSVRSAGIQKVPLNSWESRKFCKDSVHHPGRHTAAGTHPKKVSFPYSEAHSPHRICLSTETRLLLQAGKVGPREDRWRQQLLKPRCRPRAFLSRYATPLSQNSWREARESRCRITMCDSYPQCAPGSCTHAARCNVPAATHVFGLFISLAWASRLARTHDIIPSCTRSVVEIILRISVTRTFVFWISLN